MSFAEQAELRVSAVSLDSGDYDPAVAEVVADDPELQAK